MASQQEIEATYDYMDVIFRLSLGEHSDITGALYNGDFSMTINEAQAAKHKYILKGINFKEGHKILDIGCGWGPILQEVKRNGGCGIGITLSPAQVAACRRNGVEAYLKNWKDLDPKECGQYDGVISVGAFEHFCSIDELEDGKQDQIYNEFFKFCSDILPNGGRLYLQTMMWGKKIPTLVEVNTNAPKLSDEWVLGHVSKCYPGSWLPNGSAHIKKCASMYFNSISENNGRLDYIQTMEEWRKAIEKFSLKKLFACFKLLPRYFMDKEFRYQLTSLRYSCNKLCFERKIMSHQRMVFEKKQVR